MVTEIEFLVELTPKGVEKVMSHPKFWTRVGSVYKFKQELTDLEISEFYIQHFIEIKKNVPEPVVLPDDEEHVLKNSWIERGLYKPGKRFVDEKAKKICLKELDALNKKKLR